MRRSAVKANYSLSLENWRTQLADRPFQLREPALMWPSVREDGDDSGSQEERTSGEYTSETSECLCVLE